jgi:lipopolysaccharide biosynthesis glycosyltransferase
MSNQHRISIRDHLLPLQWNWQANPFATQFIERFDPNILHFIGANKPYLHNTPQHTQKYLKEYETFFSQILGKEPVRLKRNTSQPEGTAGKNGKMSKLMRKFNFYYLLAQIKKLLLGDKSGRYLSKIDRAIGSGNKLWPPSALLSGEKDTP